MWSNWKILEGIMEKYNCDKQIKGGIIFYAGVLILILVSLIFLVKDLQPYVDKVKKRIEIIEKHPTYHAYEDEWIIGKTLEEIEERYGKADLDYTRVVGYRIDVCEFSRFLTFDPDYYVYYISVDKNGVAKDVYVADDSDYEYKGFLDDRCKEKGELYRILFSLGFSYY